MLNLAHTAAAPRAETISRARRFADRIAAMCAALNDTPNASARRPVAPAMWYLYGR